MEGNGSFVMTDMDKIEVRIDRGLKERSAQAAAARGLSLSYVVRRLLIFWLDAGGPDPSAPERGTWPAAQDADQLAQSLAQAAFQLHKIKIQIATNSLLDGLDALPQSDALNFDSFQEQDPSRDSDPAPDKQGVSNDDHAAQ
jgi:hypothetical protein